MHFFVCFGDWLTGYRITFRLEYEPEAHNVAYFKAEGHRKYKIVQINADFYIIIVLFDTEIPFIFVFIFFFFLNLLAIIVVKIDIYVTKNNNI